MAQILRDRQECEREGGQRRAAYREGQPKRNPEGETSLACAPQGLRQASTEALCFQPGTSWVSRDLGPGHGTEVASRDESDCLQPQAEPGLTVGAASSSIRPQVVARFSRRSEITPARIPPVTEKGGGFRS